MNDQQTRTPRFQQAILHSFTKLLQKKKTKSMVHLIFSIDDSPNMINSKILLSFYPPVNFHC